jgi:hypothetical protein
MSRYNIEIIDGCVAYDTRINGKSINDLTEDEHDQFLEYLLKKIEEGVKNNTVSIQTLIETLQYDEFEYDKDVCEQCGDQIARTVWNI